MISLCLLQIAVGFLVGWPMTLLARALGHRLNALDGPGVAGQAKLAARKVPNTGGIAIFWGVAGPMLAIVLAVRAGLADRIAAEFPELSQHLSGLASESLRSLWLIGGMAVLHVLGLIDDRRPLGPYLKLIIMLGVSLAVVLGTGTRLLTLLDSRFGGPWLSIVITVLWFGLVTNAMNFLDNMDGLSGGVGAVASACFLAAALIQQQWFVAAALALLLGTLLGFLCFNFPWKGKGASIFMGDGGSLVLGFLLAFLTARTTYYKPELGGGWYAVFMPLVVLAVPLYDFLAVSAIRISQGRSPFVGDLNHLSHRLVRRGLSKRNAVLVIHGLTAITALGGVALGSLAGWQAVLVGVQTALVLAVVALFEWTSDRAGNGAA